MSSNDQGTTKAAQPDLSPQANNLAFSTSNYSSIPSPGLLFFLFLCYYRCKSSNEEKMGSTSISHSTVSTPMASINKLSSSSSIRNFQDHTSISIPLRKQQQQQVVKCSSSNNSNLLSGGGIVGSSRSDWQTSCSILASKVVSASASSFSADDHQDDTAIMNLVPIYNKPKAIATAITDLSPDPAHSSQLRVAYQGVPGAYSESAAGKAYPNCSAIPCDQFEVAFQAVQHWIADRAVLPIENSLGGSIHRNYDLLLRHQLYIVGEVQLPVHHCLLALPGVTKESLTRVISHPQALAQCESTLTKLGLNVARESVDDTAGAAEFIAANNLRDTAAIASARAAELYGLQVLADGIHDDSSNVTRFLMLAREPILPRTDRPFKTSIVFAHEEGTSVLFKVLSAFAFRDIDLLKIESRPQRNRTIRSANDQNEGPTKYFDYIFHVDFEASMANPRAQNAISEIQEFTSFLRVLGSYPIDVTPRFPSC